MFEIRFYEDRRGRSQAYEYIASLKKKGSKDARIRLSKIGTYMEVLRNRGTWAGEPFLKHLKGEIWELRPLDDRFMLATWTGEEFVILHQFRKKTQKTPAAEIEKAERELRDLRKRESENARYN